MDAEEGANSSQDWRSAEGRVRPQILLEKPCVGCRPARLSLGCRQPFRSPRGHCQKSPDPRPLEADPRAPVRSRASTTGSCEPCPKSSQGSLDHSARPNASIRAGRLPQAHPERDLRDTASGRRRPRPETGRGAAPTEKWASPRPAPFFGVPPDNRLRPPPPHAEAMS